MSEKVGEIYYTVSLETAEMIAAQRRIQSELDKTSGTLDKFTSKLTQVAAAVSIYASALYLIEKSDAFTKMNAQLGLATDSARELATAQEDVKRIAQESQADISAVAALYAKVSTSTKELGLSQKNVSDITRSVSLALKVSGASAEETASTILQLGQAFASGVLRGDEFNSVNEAAPRLMKALADGIGVPVGALRSMAEQGKLTSDVLAKALPRALKELDGEAKQINTIGGAFQNLQTEMMLFIGQQATASGAVKLVSGGINSLSENLMLLEGVLATVVAVKFAVWLESVISQTYATVAANRAMTLSNVAAAEAQVAATATTASLAAARVVELRAAVLAAEGAAALAVTTNGLIPAQARAAVAAEAHAAALGALSVAQRAASVTGGLASGALALMGGPLGAIVTVLGLGATAWAMWGQAAKKESAEAAKEVVASDQEIIDTLEKQNVKLRERMNLLKQKDAPKEDSAGAQRMASLLTQINALKAKGAAITTSERLDLIEYEGRYQKINEEVARNKTVTEEAAEMAGRLSAADWMKKYATDAERLNAELAKAKKELGSAFTPELEMKIRAKFGDDKTQTKRLEAQEYYAGLVADNKTALDKINAEEEKALAENRKRQSGDSANAAIYNKARLEIVKKFATERATMEERQSQDTADLNIALTTDEVQRIEMVRAEAFRRADAAEKLGTQTHLQAEQAKTLATFKEVQARADLTERNARASAETNITQATSQEQKIRMVRDEAVRQAEEAFRRGTMTFTEQENAKVQALYNANQQMIALRASYASTGVETAQDKASSGGVDDQVALIQAQAQAALDANQVAMDADAGAQELYAARKVAIETKMHADIRAARDNANQAALGSASSIADSLLSIMKNTAGEQSDAYKVAFAAQKAFAIASAIVSIQTGIAAAARDPWPANLAAMASVAAATASIVSTISSTNISGRQYGGPVSGGQLYRVNETGAPEMYTASNGSQYMLPTAGGSVTAADKIGGGGQAPTIIIQNLGPAQQVQSASYDQQTNTVKMAVAEVASQIGNNSGPVWTAMKGSTNVSSRL